jgi:integrase
MRGGGKLRREQRGRDCPPVWVLDYSTASGERKRIALSTDKRVAEMQQRELLRQRDMETMGLGAVDGQSKPLREIVDLYLNDLATRATATHVKNASARLEHVLRCVKAARVCDIKGVTLLAYRAERLRDGVSVRTANLHVDTLRACLTWAVQIALIAANPIANLPRLPENETTKRYRRRALSDEEIARFLAAARDDDERNAAHHLRVPQAPLWRAFVETGARYGELTSVTWVDIDLTAMTMVLRAETTKSHKERVIPLLEGLVRELRELQGTHVLVIGRPLRPSDRVFLSPGGAQWGTPTVNAMRIFDRTLEAAAIDRVDARGRKLDVHALRHTFASRLVRNGVGLAHAQRLLGHADPKLTARVYTHLDAADLRDAIRRLRASEPIANAGTA